MRCAACWPIYALDEAFVPSPYRYDGQNLKYNEKSTIITSNFNPSRKTVILVHGMNQFATANTVHLEENFNIFKAMRLAILELVK